MESGLNLKGPKHKLKIQINKNSYSLYSLKRLFGLTICKSEFLYNDFKICILKKLILKSQTYKESVVFVLSVGIVMI